MKLIASGAVLALTTILLVGCGMGGSAAPKQPTRPPAPKYENSYLTMSVLPSGWHATSTSATDITVVGPAGVMIEILNDHVYDGTTSADYMNTVSVHDYNPYCRGTLVLGKGGLVCKYVELGTYREDYIVVFHQMAWQCMYIANSETSFGAHRQVAEQIIRGIRFNQY